MNELSFTAEQFGGLFPYFICTDSKGIIDSFGSHLSHLCNIEPGGRFTDFFDCIRSSQRTNNAGDEMPLGEMLIIHYKSSPIVYFKGKFEKTGSSGKIIFFGTPCYIIPIRH